MKIPFLWCNKNLGRWSPLSIVKPRTNVHTWHIANSEPVSTEIRGSPPSRGGGGVPGGGDMSSTPLYYGSPMEINVLMMDLDNYPFNILIAWKLTEIHTSEWYILYLHPVPTNHPNIRPFGKKGRDYLQSAINVRQFILICQYLSILFYLFFLHHSLDRYQYSTYFASAKCYTNMKAKSK